MRRYFFLFAFIFISSLAYSQTKPKLVVGIVVDQMRYDYLYSFYSKYGNDGIKKLMLNGYNCKNTQYNYVPTYTGPGHAAIYTGTTPSVNGIVANDWYERESNKMAYCTMDTVFNTVGSDSKAGRMSPNRLLTTTIPDELRIASNKKSKVIGVALKDRGAILPAGHMANGAYWYDGTNGNWITSSFYMNELPAWAVEFNKRKLADQYINKGWTTLLPIEQYTESIADDNPYEKPFKNETKPVFPHVLSETFKVMNNYYGVIKATPFGNSITKDFALAAIKGEQLGKDEHTDFIAISFSSTDYVGHQFGPKSVELEDTYIRFDKDIAEIIKFLDTEVGKGKYTVFLTADHAAVENPQMLIDYKVPAGYFEEDTITRGLEKELSLKIAKNAALKEKFISSYINQQIYFNTVFIEANKYKMDEIIDVSIAYLEKIKGIAQIIKAETLEEQEFTLGVKHLIQNGFMTKRSGDLILNFDPAWVEFEKTGTTHGSPYSYDTHVPLLWYGCNITKGFTAEKVNITDIAPTLSLLLGIPYPNGCTGNPIPQLIKF